VRRVEVLDEVRVVHARRAERTQSRVIALERCDTLARQHGVESPDFSVPDTPVSDKVTSPTLPAWTSCLNSLYASGDDVTQSDTDWTSMNRTMANNQYHSMGRNAGPPSGLRKGSRAGPVSVGVSLVSDGSFT